MRRERIAEKMKERWDERASVDAFHFVETEHWRGDLEAFFEIGERRARAVIDPVLDEDLSRICAVELGCGVGRFSRALASRFEEVIGVDVSDEMVRRANELHRREEYPGLRFVSSDGLSLPVESKTADFVFSYEVFQHMPSRDVILANVRDVRRVLRPGGIALIHVRTTHSALRRRLPSFVRKLKARLTRVDRLKSDETFLGTSLRRSELGDLFAEAGLAVQEVRDDPTHSPGDRAFVLARPA